MGNKFDYQNMLNKIRDEKISRNKTPQFTDAQIDAWNNAIELCHHIVEGRRSKFEPSEDEVNCCATCKYVDGSICEHPQKCNNNYKLWEPQI